MTTRLKIQAQDTLTQSPRPEDYVIPIEKNKEEIALTHCKQASVTLIISPEKTFKSRTFVLINGSHPEVTDHQGVRWSKAFFNQDGKLFVDLGEKIR